MNSRKKNVVKKNQLVQNFSLNVKIQTTYTTEFELNTLCDVKLKEIKCYNDFKNNKLYYFLMISFTLYFYLQMFKL